MISPEYIKKYQDESLDIKKQLEKRTGKTCPQLYAEREKRVRDAIELKMPDRVPFSTTIGFHAYTGFANSAAYYDPIAYKTGIRKITTDLEPDMSDAGLPTSGDAMTALAVQNKMWPGGPIAPDGEYQYVEGEFMKENEYDLFLNDPTGFMIRCYLPRVYASAAPLAKLPSMDSLYSGFEPLTALLSTPEFVEMAKKFAEAGRHTAEWRQTIGDIHDEMAELGFPSWVTMAAGVGGAPFDTVSVFLRGMRGCMMDMYRRPDKLLQACDKVLERKIAQSIPADPAKRGNPKKLGMPLWRGDRAFMSDAQFKKFYWPGLKKAMEANIKLGYVPVPFFEAEFGDRLECLLELPKGKVLASIEYMDAVKAKEILGGHTCLYIRTPLSSKLWSVQEVETYVKQLIDKCGKNGGLIINIRLPDKATTADLQAMLNSIREYGKY